MATIARLSPEDEERAFEMILNGLTMEKIAKALGFTNRMAFQRYQIKYPDFQDLIQRAKLAECDYLEEELRYVAENYEKDCQRIKMESLLRILKARNGKVWGDKTQIDLNMTIDISGSLERAEKRLIDVTATNVISITTKKSED